jgi:hypothetical protein
MKICGVVEFLSVVIFTLLLCAFTAALTARSKKNLQLPAASIHQVVKDVAWNELQASEHPEYYFRYLVRDLSPVGSSTKDEIATPHGNVDKLIEVNNHSPSQQQIQKNQQLLAELPNDLQLQQSRFKDQQSNRLRRDNVIKDIPSAFTYTYAGRDRQGLIMLKFQPASGFKPSSRQSLILQGMAGELWVDPTTQRMVKIDGSLIKDVKIGWGFLARLNKGGTFLMEQSQGPDGTWHQQRLAVHFDGTVFIFKHIHIRVRQVRCCFERVPDDLSIRDAVHLLQTQTTLPRDWRSRLAAIQESTALNSPVSNATPHR